MAAEPANEAPYRLIDGVEFGADVHVHSFVNLYGCRIGAGSRIGPFVEIQAGAEVGAGCKIGSHSFICEGVRIDDRCFLGHGVVFVNDKRPRAANPDGTLQGPGDWELLSVAVGPDVSIGSGALIMGGVSLGAGAAIGAGAVVTRDVPEGATVAGVPARVLR
jgi:UDP-2-acetamido-3-amino-2,3-dideoxy-glucuronate N-acetyltransferase